MDTNQPTDENSAENDDDDDEFVNWETPNEEVEEGARLYPSMIGAIPNTPRNNLASKSNELLHPRCIIHIDFDCFYAQVEMIKNPSLKERPIAVFQKHILVSSNYVARELGVKKMSSKVDALKACPSLVFINGEDLSPYREYSERMFELLKESSPLVERVGLDENYIDVTSNIKELLQSTSSSDVLIEGHCYGFEGDADMSLTKIMNLQSEEQCTCGCDERLALASSLASKLRARLYQQLGLTSSAGIAHNKVLAKLIGKMHKPNQQTTILPTYANQFLGNKKVTDIPGIGSQAAKVLQAMDVTTVQDLKDLSREKLVEKFGAKQGEFMKNISHGIDKTAVKPSDNMLKSISEEESFRKLTSFDEVKRQMELLTKKVLSRLDKEKRLPKTIKLTLRKHFMADNYSRISRQSSFDTRILSIENSEEKVRTIVNILVQLFDKMIDRAAGFDLAVINVGFTNFHQRTISNSISNFFTNFKESPLKRSNLSHLTGESEKRRMKTMNEFTASNDEAKNKTRTANEVVGTKTSSNFANEDLSRKQCHENTSSCSVSFNPTSSLKMNTMDTNTSKYSQEKQQQILHREGVDPDIFMELPKEVQTELLNNWDQRDKSRESQSIEPPSKKQKCNKSPKTKNILNYFSK